MPRASVLRYLWRNFTVCRIAGVPVRIHSTCLFYPVGFLVWLASSGELASLQPGGLLGRATTVLLILGILWLSLLVHELAHVLVARWSGIGTRSVVFIPFGAVALLEAPMRNTRELWISAAGPAASLALAGICWKPLPALLYANHEHLFLPPLFFAVRFGCAINWMIALFNLIPCFPMDGGRMLRSLLAIGISLYSRASELRAFDLATRIVVCFVNPFVVTGAIAFTIAISHEWLHLVMFPLLLVAGEIERRAWRTEYLGADPR